MNSVTYNSVEKLSQEGVMKSSNERELYMYKFSVSLIISYSLIFLPFIWPILRHVRGRMHVPPHCLLLFCFFFWFSMYSLFKTTLFEALNSDISFKEDSNFVHCAVINEFLLLSVPLNIWFMTDFFIWIFQFGLNEVFF